MCDPVSLAATSLAFTAVQAGAGYIGQMQQAAAERKQISQWSMAQSANILNNTIDEYGQAQEQIVYHNAEAAQKEQQEDLSANSAMGTADARASSRGVTGISVSALNQEYMNKRDQYNADVEYNRKAQDNEIVDQMQGIQNQGQSQLNEVSSHYLPANPSILTPIAQIGAGAFNAYASLLKIPPTQAMSDDEMSSIGSSANSLGPQTYGPSWS